MPPLPENDIDEERKKELIMEKKLRACRVNIIQRTTGYFDSAPPPPKPPVKKKPPAPAPSPSSVEKATNPIALRYWNQCHGADRKVSAPALLPPSSPGLAPPERPPWASSEAGLNIPEPQGLRAKARTPVPVRVPDITKRVRSESVPRYCSLDEPPPQPKVEVVKILSTAGTGVKRDNERVEALGNINRFITMDKMKQGDARRLAGNKQREMDKLEVQTAVIPPDSSYDQIKQEQIKLSNERKNFMNNASNARIPKSPEPFRGKPPVEKADPGSEDSTQHKVSSHSAEKNNKPADVKHESRKESVKLSKYESLIVQITTLNDDEKRNLFLSLFHEMSFSAKSRLMTDILNELKPISAQISDKTATQATEVKNEETGNAVRKNSRLNNKEERTSVNNSVENNEENPQQVSTKVHIEEQRSNNSSDGDNTSNQPDRAHIPTIKIEGSPDSEGGDTPAEWEWEEGEELEYEFYEQEVTKL